MAFVRRIATIALMSHFASGQAIEPIQPKRVPLQGVWIANPIVQPQNPITSRSNAHVTFRDNRIPPPLFVVDGKIIATEGLSKINTERIDNITILKGKEATDRFGANGANGAIMFTMKKWYWFHHKKSRLR